MQHVFISQVLETKYEAFELDDLKRIATLLEKLPRIKKARILLSKVYFLLSTKAVENSLEQITYILISL